MKNRFILMLSIIFAIFISCNVYATNIKIFIDGEQKFFNPPPIIKDGTTLVPMRDCFETLGAKIYWFSSTKSVLAIRENTLIQITIGKHEAYVNKNKIYLNVEPQLVEDKTYVPLRFVSESLGAQVYWDEKTRTITIFDKIRKKDKIKLLDTQKYELRTTFTFVNKGDKIDSEFEILCGSMSNSPYQKDEALDVKPVPYDFYEDEFGNKFAKIKINNIMPSQTVNIVVTKKLSNSGIEYLIDGDILLNDYNNLNNYKTYISPQIQTESNDPLIVNKALELAGQEKNPYKIARKVFEFVNLYMTYDTSEKYARKGALSALKTGRGVCEDYSKLFVALLRANKIPARSVFGYWINDDIKKEINYDTWYNLKEAPHEWPEFYLPEYGWVIAEPTFILTINGNKTVPWDQFAKQKSNGHIIYGYEPNTEHALKWNISGYGILNLEFVKMDTEIRKIK